MTQDTQPYLNTTAATHPEETIARLGDDLNSLWRDQDLPSPIYELLKYIATALRTSDPTTTRQTPDRGFPCIFQQYIDWQTNIEYDRWEDSHIATGDFRRLQAIAVAKVADEAISRCIRYARLAQYLAQALSRIDATHQYSES